MLRNYPEISFLEQNFWSISDNFFQSSICEAGQLYCKCLKVYSLHFFGSRGTDDAGSDTLTGEIGETGAPEEFCRCGLDTTCTQFVYFSYISRIFCCQKYEIYTRNIRDIYEIYRAYPEVSALSVSEIA